ncbi:hypothetical protein B0H16DRAFT_1739089 [Mycena metata]|uniref:BTB domain-containing protein n=1 Tax=Mycena metata TaxID=1033252 RepID=A0AAD7HGX0_9AGAR|nr:hypothetical protein B0H16DRAFT_1739089 [Mycena metata]
MEDAPRTKRRRTDTAAECETEPAEILLTRSTEYWFDGGDIILRVESTQFRLFKSILSMHSSVFRDMSLPVDEMMVENCPVIVLSGDTVREWVLFLGIMFPKSHTTELPNVELLVAMLRLSKKYDFALFREGCVRRLKQEFPSTLQEYDVVSRGWMFINVDAGRNEDGLFSLISVAREIGLSSVLPSLYYSILGDMGSKCMLKILDLDDTCLSTTDRLACLRGCLQLRATTTLTWLDVKSTPRHIPSRNCSCRDKCAAAAENIFLNVSSLHLPVTWPLDVWESGWDDEMCSHCENEAKEIHEAGRETCWQQLPAAFGLPDWTELKALDFDLLIFSAAINHFGLSEDKCSKFVSGKKSAVGDKAVTKRNEKPISWTRLPYATAPILTTSDVDSQKVRFIEVWNEDGVSAEPEDEFT